jgi:hypothetical protein
MLGADALRSHDFPTIWQPALRRLFWCSFGLLFVSVLAIPGLAKAPQATVPSTVEAQVKRFGVGKDVKVTLTGGKKLRGHISSIGENSFTIRLQKSKADREIRYDQVALVKDPGPLVWILVGVAVAVIVIVVVH